MRPSVPKINPGWASATNLNLTTAVAVISILAIVLPATPGGQVLGCVGLFTSLGVETLSLMKLRFDSLGQRCVAVGAAGLTSFLALSFMIGFVPRVVGLELPLSRRFSELVVAAILLILAAKSYRSGHDPLRMMTSGLTKRHVTWAAILSVPPLLALIGVNRLNATGSNVLSLVVSGIVLLMIGFAVITVGRSVSPPSVMVLMSAVVTMAWQLTMRGGWLSGFDVNSEIFISRLTGATGHFPLAGTKNPYYGMLSLTTLPTEMHSLFGVQLRTFFAIFPAIALAGTVAAIWYAVRRFVGPRTSIALLLVAIVGSQTYVSVLPATTRQCWALFLLSVFLMILVDTPLPVARARWFVIALAFGIAATHYSTSFLLMAAITVVWLLNEVLRVPSEKRFLTAPTCATILAISALWQFGIARVGHSLTVVARAIGDSGLNILPSGGNPFTRWLQAASINQLQTAHQVRLADIAYRHGIYKWMTVTPFSRLTSLRSDNAPTTTGSPISGAIVQSGSALLSQLFLLAIIIGFAVLARSALKRRRHVELAGITLLGGIVSAGFRLSQTLASQLGTARIQAEMNLIFVIAVAAALATMSRQVKLMSRAPRLADCAVALFLIAVAMQLTNYAAPKGALPAAFAVSGEQLERTVTPSDLVAGQWALAHVGSHDLQSDYFAQFALNEFGTSDRSGFIATVDPIVIDNYSWIFANYSNIDLGRARGSTPRGSGTFRFTERYFSSTRDVLYSSNRNVIYGTYVTSPAR